MNRSANALAADLAIGLLAGVIATKVTGFAQQGSYQLMPERVKKQEEEVRPGEPPQVAAEKTAQLFGVQLKGEQLKVAGEAVHWSLGAAWGPLYGLLRRYSRMSPVGAGFVSGAAMSLIVDEALTSALGFSAPDDDYPPITHVRGFMNHLVFGAANAVAAEALYRALDLVRGTGPKLAPVRP